MKFENSDNVSVLLKEVLETSKQLTELKTLLSSTDNFARTMILQTNSNTEAITLHQADIAVIKDAISSLQKEMDELQENIQYYIADINNIYLTIKRYEKKEDRIRKLKKIPILITDHKLVALLIGMLGTVFIAGLVELVLTILGNLFGIDKSLLDIFITKIN